MENRETGIRLLKAHHFEFPRRRWSSMCANASAAPELQRRTGVKSLPKPNPLPLCRHDPLMPVNRRYRPGPAALDELIDVLYQLLVDAPVHVSETPDSAAPAAPEPTCFLTKPE